MKRSPSLTLRVTLGVRPLNSLEALLERLNSGDDTAAEQVFVAYEPFLRRVVRRMLPGELRSKFDSIDVVQSVWGDVLSGFRGGELQFQSSAHLRAFLVKATHNRFIDRVRQHRTAARLERPLSVASAECHPPAPAPRASEVAQATELWERMLAACPAEHRPILQLRRDGFSLNEIAAQISLHEGSVRRILRSLSVKFASDSAAPLTFEVDRA